MMVLYKVQFDSLYIWLAIALYHVNTYVLNSAVFNVIYKWYILITIYSIIDPCSIMLKVPLKESS